MSGKPREKAASPSEEHEASWLIPIAVAMVGLALTLAVAWGVQQALVTRELARFEVPMIIVGGVLTTSILFGTMRILIRGRADAENSAAALRRSEEARSAGEARLVELNRDLVRKVSEFETLLDVLPVGIAVAHDPECREVTSNSTLHRLLGGRPPSEASWPSSPLGYRVYGSGGQEVPPRDLPLARAARGEEVLDFEMDGRTDAHGQFTALGYAAPLFDENGQPRGAISAMLDITTRKRAEDALRRSESRFRTLIEHLPVAIAVYREGRFLYVNPAMVGMLVYPRAEDLVGRAFLDTVVGEDQPALQRALRAYSYREDSGPVVAAAASLELRHMRCDGEIVFSEGFLLPIVFDGAPAALGIWHDVTQRKQLAARMMQMDRMIAVGTLAAGVAHEINNPLAYVMANLDFALEELRTQKPNDEGAPKTLPVELADALTEAREGAERVRRIVRDLKMCSRFDDEKGGPVDLKRVIEWSASMAQNEIRHRARLVSELEALPLVEANEGRLGQVFLNLLVNAAQAIPEGAADVNQIRVSTRMMASDQVVVEIRDTGVGISAEHLPRIFDPFFTTKPIGVGTGLGLAMCQRIVADIGGEIRVESERGRGATFRVLLPVSPATLTVPPATLQAGASPLRGRVLVVDDEVLVLRAVERALVGRHETVLVPRAEEALQMILRGERYDLVLCDLMMPEMTGMELYEQLASAAPEQARAMVFITGGAYTPRAREFLARVSNGRLDKPFDVEGLRRLVQQHVERSVARASIATADGSDAARETNAPS